MISMEEHLKVNTVPKITKHSTNLGFHSGNSSYIATKRIAKVVDCCFGHSITCNYELKLYQFDELFIQTGLSALRKSTYPAI